MTLAILIQPGFATRQPVVAQDIPLVRDEQLWDDGD
jgi:hypothetical protein